MVRRVLCLCVAPIVAALYGWPLAAVCLILAAIPSRKPKESSNATDI
jgi:hypothetical protein